jgi:SAM-dependent methyltransferase
MCPLCGHAQSQPSWLGALHYAGREFPYVECTSCRSLYASPMPDEATLSRMYGLEYETAAAVAPGHGIEDPKERRRVVAWLKDRPAGTFVDYGCGGGHLLASVSANGWRALGVEFDPDVAAATAQRVGVPVASRFSVDALATEPPADVLHLGDVVEHLTHPDEELPRILRLIKPGGYLIAQGPLEANASLFTNLLKLARRVRGVTASEMPPYHVMLATAAGQRAFFQRFGLREVVFSMSEVAWPAPARLKGDDIAHPRLVALYLIRRLSQMLSSLQPDRWGNRYFYVGQRP